MAKKLPRAALRLPSLLAGTALAGLFACGNLMAQTTGLAPAVAPGTPVPAAAASKPAVAKAPPVRTTVTKPLWTELTPMQQQALRPLAAGWNTLSDPQKRKWLAMSQNYGSLPSAEQARLHERAAEWVALSPQQRSQARLNFGQTKELTPAEKQAMWEAYQALSPDERKKLADGGATRPPGAATPVKPVPRQKFTALPDAAKTNRPVPRIAVAPNEIDPHTLLPQSPIAGEPAAVQQ